MKTPSPARSSITAETTEKSKDPRYEGATDLFSDRPMRNRASTPTRRLKHLFTLVRLDRHVGPGGSVRSSTL
jgi:hypothetical protein